MIVKIIVNMTICRRLRNILILNYVCQTHVTDIEVTSLNTVTYLLSHLKFQLELHVMNTNEFKS